MELIDVYDENNNYLGYAKERDEVHKNKLWHRHVSAWIMNSNGEVLMQQRALTKMKNPGKWSRTGGHVDSKETCDEAIKREIYEEIGLLVDDKDINNIEIFKSIDPLENYYSYGYIFFTDKKEEEFILQEEEVNKVKYFTIEELEQFKKDNNQKFTFSKWDIDGFNKQMSLLKKYRELIK